MRRLPLAGPRGLAIVTLTLLAGAHPAEGQDGVLIRGTVLDAQTGDPVPGAFVAPVGSARGTVSDSAGAFVIGLEPADSYHLQVRRLGYTEAQLRVGFDEVAMPLTVQLSPNPLELEGLTVLAESLARRRVGPFGVADVLDREDLLASPESSGYQFLLRVLPFVEKCNMESDALCMVGRMSMGEKRQVQVCLDDRRVPPDFMESLLAPVDPRGLYLVEAYTRVGEVRMYTPGYIKRLIAQEGSLPPLSFGCAGGG
ncbi:MAG: carboxypeptidase-like regulatory domain-containing protein [Gemmatimonadota bacterium]|jgi:hypothetical protein